jgi:hypothetical protein
LFEDFSSAIGWPQSVKNETGLIQIGICNANNSDTRDPVKAQLPPSAASGHREGSRPEKIVSVLANFRMADLST